MKGAAARRKSDALLRNWLHTLPVSSHRWYGYVRGSRLNEGRWIVLPGNRRTAIRLRWYVNRILFHWFRRYVSSWIVDEDAQNVRPICVWSLNPAYMLCLLFVETLAHSHISTLKCSDSPCFIIFNVGQSLLPTNLFIFRTVNLTINGGLANEIANINI